MSELSIFIDESGDFGEYDHRSLRKVMPADYKLFQAADLICSLTLVKLKLENNMFSKSEKTFFGNIRDLKKNYLKPLSKKEWR